MQRFDLKDYVTDGVSVETLMELVPIDKGDVSFGVASFSAGSRHPQEGMTSHDQHEVSYLIEGRLKLLTDAGSRECEPGEVVWLEPDENHASETLEDAKVFWVLYG